MVSWKVLILSVALVTENVSAARRARIFDGSVAKIEDFPYQALILENSNLKCGGAIISERHIITAGHCITSLMVPPYKKSTVITGTNHRYKEGNSHEVDNITVHPDFFKNWSRALNDVAIITLKDKIVFDKYQRKIYLPKENVKVGQKVIVTGWGFTHLFPIIEPDLLQQLQTEIISKEECQEQLVDPEDLKIYDTELCTDNPEGSGTCWGDSGGPLVANDELIGIVSWTDGPNCGFGYPNVYTNVFKFKDFIESVVNSTV